MFCQNFTVNFQLIYYALIYRCIVPASTNTPAKINKSFCLRTHFHSYIYVEVFQSARFNEKGESPRFRDPSSPPRTFSKVDNLNMAAARKLPETFRKLVITKLSTNYREAVESLTVPMLQPKPDELLLKNRWVTLIYSW